MRENWIGKRKHQFIYLFFSKSQIFIPKIGELGWNEIGFNEILIKTLKISLYINPFDIYIYIYINSVLENDSISLNSFHDTPKQYYCYSIHFYYFILKYLNKIT